MDMEKVMTYKTLTVEGECEEHGEWASFFVVPDHVSGAEFLMGEEGSEPFCECYSQDDADLIVSLLNKEARH